MLGKHDWDKGKVTRRLDQRSYEFQFQGTTYRRNRQHLVKSPPAHTQHEAAKQTVPDPLPQAQQSRRRQIANHKNYEQRYRLLEAKQSSPVRTRTGRVIKEPVRFQDYFKAKNRCLFITRNWDYIVIGLVSASFSWITELFLNGHLEVLSSLVSCCYNYVLVNCVYFFLISGSNDVLVKLTVSARELSKEQQEKIDEILQLHVQLYTENHKLSSPNGVRAFVQHITRAYNLAVESVEMGSLIITVKCPTLESLERLWSDYQSGCLDDIAEIFLLTTDIKSKLDLDIVRFKITIEEENYLAFKRALSGKLSNFSEAF